MIDCLAKELILRKDELKSEIECIYFGGGTPSLLTIDDIRFLISEIYQNYKIAEKPEITLEANPDDLSEEKIIQLSQSPVNRLSIGIQSFFEDDLKLMNRAHNAEEAEQCLSVATRYFKNITLDLIYGIPKMSSEKWLQNINKALSFDIPHISAYALTVEPKTALKTLIEKGKIPPVDETLAAQHYHLLVTTLEKNGYVNYEFSNFGKPEYFSRNNTAYWTGKPYIGVGPSAHSYDGNIRSWNIANNTLYIKGINSGERVFESEKLSVSERFNEYLMTSLRTMWGVSLTKIQENFGEKYLTFLHSQAENHLKNKNLIIENNRLHITKEAKFLGDGIIADLFWV